MLRAPNSSLECVKVPQWLYWLAINPQQLRSILRRSFVSPIDQTYLLTLVPLCYLPAAHQGRNLHNSLRTMAVPRKISPNGVTRAHSRPWLPTQCLQAFKLRDRDHIEYTAGMSWRPRLCALVVLSAVQLSIMCRAQDGISFYVSLCRH